MTEYKPIRHTLDAYETTRKQYETAILTDLVTAEACLKERDAALAECYKASGAEPSGEDWRDALYAVREVWRLRKESEEENEMLAKQVKERDAEIEKLREEIKQLNKINGE